MRKIRVFLACPQVKDFNSLRQMISQQPELEIVGDVDNPIDTLIEVGNTQTDIAVIDLGYRGEDPGLCSHLLSEYPHIKVMAVARKLDRANVYEIGIIERYLEDISSNNIADIIYSSFDDEQRRDA